MAQQTAENVKTTNENKFNMATDSFRSAMDAGMKFQKDAFETMSKMFNCNTECCDVNAKMEDTTTDAINMVRKNAEQTQKAFDENCRTGLSTIRKSFDAMQEDDKDMFTRAGDIWNCWFDGMRGNVDMMAKTTTQAIENWSEFMTKTMKNGGKKVAK